jgi:hypothetical protein
MLDVYGWDYINGGMDNDFCLGTKDGGGHDVVVGGPGLDYGWADRADTVLAVEHRRCAAG